MKLKIAVVTTALAVLAILTAMPVCAWTTEEAEEYASAAGVDTVDNGNEYLTENEKNGDATVDFRSKLLIIIKDTLDRFFGGASKTFVTLTAAIILSSVFRCVRGTVDSTPLSQTYDFFSVLVISGIAFSAVSSVFATARAALDGGCVYFTALLPVMNSLYTMGGNTAAAVASNSSIVVFISAVELITAKVLMPFLRITFALSVASALPSSINLSSVTNLVKNTVSVILSFLFSMFGFVMFFQTIVASAADNAAYRSVKFVSGVFIPVIGGVIGDSVRTVFASVNVIRATTGALGTVVMLSTLLPPIIITFLYKGAVLLSSSVARMLGCDNESRLLADINSILSLVAAMLIGTSVLFVVSLAIFIKTGIDL